VGQAGEMSLRYTGLDVPAVLRARARNRAAHPFLVWAPFDGPGRTWTYAQFADEVSRIAGGLAARGVTPGDRVIVHMENCPELLLAWFACLHLGAICVNTNAASAGPELEYFAQMTGAVGALTQPQFEPLFSIHCKQLGWLATTGHEFDSLYKAPLGARPPLPGAAATIMFTSGTTSRPKGVLWTHANALWGGQMGALQMGLRPQDVYQVFLPLCHVVGLSWSVLAAFWAGATVVLQPKFSASRLWPVALEHGSTVTSHVQFTTAVMARQAVPRGHRFRLWGTSAWLPEHESHFGAKMLGWWGMTEVVTQGIVGDLYAPQRPRSIGRPSTGIRIRIEDDEGQPVKDGGTGNLLVKGVRGVALFAEYFGNAGATAEAFNADGYFRTGDRVTLHEDGSIQFADRVKDMIKVGGEGVSGAEIERTILAVEGVGEAAVVARPDPVYGEVAVAFIVTKEGAAPDIAERVAAHCRASLARFKVPREVIVTDSIRTGTLGKISKAELRARLAQQS
jgi:crotonobetaine/carnitine-CoA ligase